MPGQRRSDSTTPTSSGRTGWTLRATTRLREIVFKLARVVMRKPLYAKLVTIKSTTVAGRPITNRNDLLFTYPDIIGVKTGHTSNAGWSEVAAARRDGLTIYAVLLGGLFA